LRQKLKLLLLIYYATPQNLVNFGVRQRLFCQFTKSNCERIFKFKFIFGSGPAAGGSPLSQALGQGHHVRLPPHVHHRSPCRSCATSRRWSHVTPARVPGYKSCFPIVVPLFPSLFSFPVARRVEQPPLDSPVSASLSCPSSTQHVVCTSPFPLTFCCKKKGPDIDDTSGIQDHQFTASLTPPLP
jgi:hypothetical protein